jgi:hypothetical protein
MTASSAELNTDPRKLSSQPSILLPPAARLLAASLKTWIQMRQALEEE